MSAILEAGTVKHPNIELQSNDGKDDNGKENKKADLQQWGHCSDDGLEHNLKA